LRPFVAQDIYRYTCERIFLGWLTGAPALLASLQKGVDGIENHPEHLRFTLQALFAFSLFCTATSGQTVVWKQTTKPIEACYTRAARIAG
jgi:hypothetical protein